MLSYPTHENNAIYDYYRENSIEALRKDNEEIKTLLVQLLMMWSSKKNAKVEDFMPWLKENEPKVDKEGNLPDFGLVDVKD